jgi:hypothetical protein
MHRGLLVQVNRVAARIEMSSDRRYGGPLVNFCAVLSIQAAQTHGPYHYVSLSCYSIALTGEATLTF